MKPDHKRIWLQPGAGDCGETTWCQDRINDDDIEYVREDIHVQALLAARQEGRKEAFEEAAKVCEDNTECVGSKNRRWLEPFDPINDSQHSGMTYAAAIRSLEGK